MHVEEIRPAGERRTGDLGCKAAEAPIAEATLEARW